MTMFQGKEKTVMNKQTNRDADKQIGALTDLALANEQAEQIKGGRTGNAGNDVLVGGSGRDVLLGGGGLDILIANTGGDR